MRMWWIAGAVAALLPLAGCARGPSADVARLTPPQMQVCVERVLERHSVRVDPAPFPGGLWRLRLSVLSGPPAGWIDKGSVVHTGSGISYIANGATAGLNERQVRAALDPVFELCR